MPTIIVEYTLDLLTSISVSIIEQSYIKLDESSNPVPYGSRSRTAYQNSQADRDKLQSFLPESHYNAIIAMWGPEPTIDVSNDEEGLVQEDAD